MMSVLESGESATELSLAVPRSVGACGSLLRLSHSSRFVATCTSESPDYIACQTITWRAFQKTRHLQCGLG